MSDYPNIDRLHIVYYPDEVLARPAEPVREVGSFHQELAHRMAELMIEAQGVGLAANQVGLLERFIVLSPTGELSHAEAFLNPRIVEAVGRETESEGCLSLPGVRGRVTRAESVTVTAERLNGETVTMTAEGLLARAWQHEIDHLNGVLFVEKLGAAARLAVARGLRRLEKAFREEPS